MKDGSASCDVLCDNDRDKMTWESYQIKDSPDRDQRAFYLCKSEGCPRHFAPSLGYVDMLNGQLEPTNRIYRLCENSPTHGKMSKAIVRVEGGQSVWECIYCLAKGPGVKGSVSQVA